MCSGLGGRDLRTRPPSCWKYAATFPTKPLIISSGFPFVAPSGKHVKRRIKGLASARRSQAPELKAKSGAGSFPSHKSFAREYLGNCGLRNPRERLQSGHTGTFCSRSPTHCCRPSCHTNLNTFLWRSQSFPESGSRTAEASNSSIGMPPRSWFFRLKPHRLQ